MVVKEKALSHFSVGAHPSVVHKQFVNEAPLPLSGADVPSLSQLKNWKYRLSMNDAFRFVFSLLFFFFFFFSFFLSFLILSTGDVFYNITKKHPTFTRLCIHHPDIQVVLVSNFGLSILKESETVFVDGTFRTTECKLVLTILMGLRDDIAIPCAFLLLDSRETSMYKSFFKVESFFFSPFSFHNLFIRFFLFCSLLFFFFIPFSYFNFSFKLDHQDSIQGYY
jgi:hypothetical protein